MLNYGEFVEKMMLDYRTIELMAYSANTRAIDLLVAYRLGAYAGWLGVKPDPSWYGFQSEAYHIGYSNYVAERKLTGSLQ